VEAKKNERRQSARIGTSTSHAPKGSKDDALDRAMESHREDMERYFKIKEEHHVKDAELRRLELQQQIAQQEIRKQELEFEQQFHAMQANQLRQLEIMQEGQRSQSDAMQATVREILAMQAGLIENCLLQARVPHPSSNG